MMIINILNKNFTQKTTRTRQISFCATLITTTKQSTIHIHSNTCLTLLLQFRNNCNHNPPLTKRILNLFSITTITCTTTTLDTATHKPQPKQQLPYTFPPHPHACFSSPFPPLPTRLPASPVCLPFLLCLLKLRTRATRRHTFLVLDSSEWKFGKALSRPPPASLRQESCVPGLLR